MRKLLTCTAFLALALAGCSSPGATTGTQSSDPPDMVAKWTAYATCLQKQGVDAHYDPDDGIKMPANVDSAKQDAAEAACRSIAPGGLNATPDAAQLDQSLKMAQCLRGKGVKIKDPTQADPEPKILDPKPADLQELVQACDKLVGPGRGGSRH